MAIADLFFILESSSNESLKIKQMSISLYQSKVKSSHLYLDRVALSALGWYQ